MNKNTAMIVLVVLLLGVGGFFLYNSQQSTQTPTPTPAQQVTPTSSETMEKEDVKEEPEKADESMEKEDEVEISGFKFAPATITVKKGSTVTWTNKDSVKHNVHALDDSFKTELMAQGESQSVTFDEAGTFEYKCDPHPNMRGTVVVEE